MSKAMMHCSVINWDGYNLYPSEQKCLCRCQLLMACTLVCRPTKADVSLRTCNLLGCHVFASGLN